MLGYDQDRYAALLAASALETRRALARRMGYRETTNSNGGPRCRDPQLLEAVAIALTQGEMTKPQLKAAVESELEREVSINTLDKYLCHLIRAGRAKRMGLVSANIPGKFAVFSARQLVSR